MAERDRRMEDEEGGGFLRRWSKRKAEARRGESTAPDERDAPPDPEVPAAAAVGAAAPDQAGDVEPVDPRDLPDIDSLHQGSDFTVFMRPGVPEELRTLALRRLWRLDPSFSRLDGLVEYGEDYTIKKHAPGAIKTAYQVGRGFVNRSEEARADAPEPAPVPGAPEHAPPAEQPAVAAGETPALEPGGVPAADASQEADREETPSDEPAAARRRPLPRRG